VAERMSVTMGAKVEKALNQLDVLRSIKNGIGWELVPGLIPLPGGRPGEAGFVYMLALSVPVGKLNGQGVAADYVIHVAQLEDPNGTQASFDQALRSLYTSAQAEADARQAQAAAPANGGRTSPGGLHLP
jgi:hypothetical protein